MLQKFYGILSSKKSGEEHCGLMVQVDIHINGAVRWYRTCNKHDVQSNSFTEEPINVWTF